MVSRSPSCFLCVSTPRMRPLSLLGASSLDPLAADLLQELGQGGVIGQINGEASQRLRNRVFRAVGDRRGLPAVEILHDHALQQVVDVVELELHLDLGVVLAPGRSVRRSRRRSLNNTTRFRGRLAPRGSSVARACLKPHTSTAKRNRSDGKTWFRTPRGKGNQPVEELRSGQFYLLDEGRATKVPSVPAESSGSAFDRPIKAPRADAERRRRQAPRLNSPLRRSISKHWPETEENNKIKNRRTDGTSFSGLPRWNRRCRPPLSEC